MWFFGNKVESAETDAFGFTHEFHREKTQKINTKPSEKALDKGFLLCSKCGVEIDLQSYTPLSIDRCPHCETPVFIPMLIKDYWLYEPLGGGGMGSVYHAFRKDDPDIEAAVKILPRERKTEPYLIESLITEAKICWQLGDHQHLNKVLDYGLYEDEYYAVFEYIEGTRLDQIIDSPIKRAEKQVILWAMQILSAEQHMFDKGFLFRDLKPQNIMIDKNGNVKLFDFGLAMPIEHALHNDSEQIQGSPYYMPPERIVGAGESQYSEIYSLGMVLFHIIAKQPYYSAEDIKSLVGKHVISMRVNNVRSKLPHMTNRNLVSVMEKMIARSPGKRYHTYKETAAALFQIYKSVA
jgi:serine/threonine-protein kinase